MDICPRPGAFVQYVSEMSACSEVIPESCVAEYSVLSIVSGARECELDAARGAGAIRHHFKRMFA